MGTRAAFWIGNPQDLDKREWLGCVAFDGYPEGLPGIEDVKTEKEFRAFIARKRAESTCFAKPEGGWPYPWDDDIFLTDYTYAFFDGKLQVTVFHSGFQTLEDYQRDTQGDHDDDRAEPTDKLPSNVPAPKTYDRRQPDSIIIVSAKS